MKATISLHAENKKASITVVEADQNVVGKLIEVAMKHITSGKVFPEKMK